MQGPPLCTVTDKIHHPYSVLLPSTGSVPARKKYIYKKCVSWSPPACSDHIKAQVVEANLIQMLNAKESHTVCTINCTCSTASQRNIRYELLRAKKWALLTCYSMAVSKTASGLTLPQLTSNWVQKMSGNSRSTI